MRLVSVRVKKFRNIIDSGEVDIGQPVTCLVGKNESGKTAFLHALYRLNPARPNVQFSVPDQYPAWMEKRDRQKGGVLEDVQPIRATFVLDEGDKEALGGQFGHGVVKNNFIEVSKDYDNRLRYAIDLSETSLVEHVIENIEWMWGTKTEARKAKSINELRQYSQALRSQATEKGDSYKELAQDIEGDLEKRLQGKGLGEAVWEFMRQRIPSILYFSDYSKLPYSVSIQNLLTGAPSQLNDGELTARALLMLAAAEKDYLVNPDYERRKRELENVANALTDDVLRYWSQNPELRVLPDISQETIKDNRGSQSVLSELKIRIWDQRHSLSLPFDEHSTGFQWFFSFLAAFSKYEYQDNPVVILLDEPALGLHAR